MRVQIGAAALCGLGAWALASVATAAASPGEPGSPVAVEEERLIEGPFWVDAVNRSERTVTVHGSDGSRTIVNVSPNATGFDNLKRGDRVDLDYFRSVVVALTPSGGTSTELMEAPAQPKPAIGGATANNAARATSAGKGRVTAWGQLTAVNAERGTIQFRSSDGAPQTLYVREQALWHELRNLKPGDRVNMTYTPPVAMSIRASQAR